MKIKATRRARSGTFQCRPIALAQLHYDRNWKRVSTIFFDIDTQLDFVCPSGALYVPGAERIVPAVARLNRYAAAHGVVVVSTVDAHSENDVEFRDWPPHCVAGALGQHKAGVTLLDRRVVVPNRPCPLDFGGAQQIILEKQNVDAFTVPNLLRILELLPADRYVVYGVVAELCVLHAARGLLKTGKPVTIVTDAVEGLEAASSARALGEVTAAGGTLARTADFC
jgi:nicotinamidase/pyrazinamidase